MANHKRKRPRNRRSGCKMCKYWKVNGFATERKDGERFADFALIAWPDMDVVVRLVPFIESEAVPSDSRVLGQTWQYVNKDGSPDRRFTANRVLPIMEYTDLLFTTAGGVNEAYCLSNAEKAWALHQALLDYKALFVA